MSTLARVLNRAYRHRRSGFNEHHGVRLFADACPILDGRADVSILSSRWDSEFLVYPSLVFAIPAGLACLFSISVRKQYACIGPCPLP